MPGPVQALMFIAQNLLAYRHRRPRCADEPKATPQPLQPHALSTDAFKQERKVTGAGWIEIVGPKLQCIDHDANKVHTGIPANPLS